MTTLNTKGEAGTVTLKWILNMSWVWEMDISRSESHQISDVETLSRSTRDN